MKKTLLLLLLLFTFFNVSAQCAYPGNSAAGTYTFCIDNLNTITTTNVTAGQYVLLNVVSGFNYTFSVGNSNTTENENLTLFDSSNTFITGGYNSGASAATITWTATLSGQIKILFSSGSCVNSGGSSGAISLKLNSVGNNLDSQTAFGTDQWVGHVYNWTGTAPPGGTTSSTSPSTTTSPFTDANYVGYYNVANESINEGFGGSYNCFSVLSNGVNRTNIHTQLFAVRYRMKSTKSGCYFLNVSGDDGVRVYVDNVLVFDKWKEQGATYYCNNLIYLNGSSNIILDYYENSGANVVGLDLVPFDGSTNIISSSADVKVCSGVSPGLINASSFSSCTGGNNGGTNTTYKWQVSTDNVSFNDISGATSEDYTPGTITTSTSTVINYYRRVLIPFASNGSSCSFSSASVKVTTNPSTKTFTTAPISTSCSDTDIIYTTQSGMINYVWTVPGTLDTDYSITSGSTGSTSNTVTLKWLTSGSKTVTVNYTSSCSGSTAATNTTTVGLAPNNIGNGFSATTICVGDTPKLNFDAEDATFSSPYTITYRNDATLSQYTITIPDASLYSFTPADNPTSNATYTLLSISNATCTRTSNFGDSGASLIVRALPTASISGTTSVCQGSASPSVTFTNPQTAAITVTYNINGGTSAAVDVAGSSSTTVAAPTTVTGTYTYNLTKVEYKSLSSCSSTITGKSAVVTVSSSTAPTIGTVTNINCVNSTGSVVLNDLPSSGTWSIKQTGDVAKTYTGTGISTTISGLTAGTYSFTVSTTSLCASVPSATVTITGVETKTWNGTAWSGPITGTAAPTLEKNIDFTGSYNLNLDIEGCSCKIGPGVAVTIQAEKYLKIVNQVEINATGSLTIENKGSLVQINDNASNSGNIIYNRTTPEILKTDYVYWSSPVALAQLSAIQTGTLYYSFNGSGNSWVNANANTIMDTGKGYIVRGAGTWFDTGNITLTANFIGAPNNGEKVVTIVGAGKNNLIGNPYPSAIDGEAFLTANTDVPGGTTDFLEGALYFWTHKSAIQLASGIAPEKVGSGAYAYTSDDYSPFTKVGGTNSVTGYIAAGQGFFARGSTTGGQAKFVNSMRLDGDKILDNSGFLKSVSISKSEKATTTTKIEKSRIWLNLTNTQGAFKQVLLGYMTGATNSYDRGYDALSFNGNSFINFYSINNSSLLTIQGRALPIQENDAVPLGYSSTIVGDFSISIDKADGALSTMAVYLEDKLTDTTHDLKKGAYTFTTEIGTFNERFVLSYVDKVSLATNDFEVLENQVVIRSKNKEININASTNYIDKVFVYDVTGKQIFSKSKIDKSEFVISNLGNTDQVLIVKVLLQNNNVVTKKIIF